VAGERRLIAVAVRQRAGDAQPRGDATARREARTAVRECGSVQVRAWRRG